MATKNIKIKFTIDGIEKEVDNLEDFTKEMKKAGMAAEKAEKQQGFFAKKQEELNEKYKEFKATLGEVKTGIGNAFKGLKNLAKGFKLSAISGKAMGKAIGAAVAATGIGLLVTAVVGLIEYFKNLEGGAKAVKKVFAGIGAVIGQLGKAIEALRNREFSKAAEAVRNIGEAVKESAAAVDEQFEAEGKLSKLRQKTIVENAKLTQEIEAQKKVLEDTTLSTEERLAALDKVTAATKELAENQREETRLALEQAEADLVNINNYEERRQKQEEIAQLQADLIDQTTQLMNIEYDAARVAREIRQAEADEKQRLHEEELARIEEEKAAKEEADAKEKQRQTDLRNLLRQYAIDDLNDAYAKAQAELAQIENDIQLAQGAFGAIAALAGEGSAVAKAAALAQIGIDTFVGAQKAFNSQFIPGDPTSAVRATIAAGTAVAFGIANAQKVLATPIPGGETAGGGTVPSAPTLPSFVPQTTGDQTAGETLTLGEQQGSQAVVKAYVVAEEMSSQQEANKRINDLSRL
jgi:hypothetical protein